MENASRRRILAGLAAAASLPFLSLGCGETARIDDAVVEPDPAAPASKSSRGDARTESSRGEAETRRGGK